LRLLLLFAVFLSTALSQSASLFEFEPNLGQYPANVRFLRRASGTTGSQIYLTRDAMVLRNGVRLQITDVDPAAVMEGVSSSSTIYNYYVGSNPANWRTNVRLSTGVRLANIYPGASALFTNTIQAIGLSSIGRGAIVLTLQPGADLSRFRLRVLNIDTVPFEGPGGIWFSGGRIPGVFTVTVQSTAAASLKIESSDTLSLQATGLSPTAPTEFVITFPNYADNFNPPVGNPYIASLAYPPRDFGTDGSVAGPACEYMCSDAIVARFDGTGKPVWVDVIGGEREDEATAAIASTNGVAVSGTTASRDFPITANAPRPAPGSTQDIFLGFFDRDSGQLRNSTYGGIEGTAWVQQVVADSGGDLGVGGGFTTGETTRGYLLRWRPSENRFLFSQRLDAPVAAAIFDAGSNLHYAAVPYPSPAFTVGAVDAAGRPQGSVVTVPSLVDPNEFTINIGEILIQPAGGGDVWTVYRLFGKAASSRALTAVAKTSSSRGQVILNRRIVNDGIVTQLALTPAGNLKLLARSPAWTEVTTADAPLVAACPDTNYFVILSAASQPVYATYVPREGFDFGATNEPQSPAPARLNCFANTAGRLPSPAAAAGQLITLTGGGFGPPVPIYTAPGADGKYPLTAEGFQVRIGGLDAPIIAVARGLIAVQVPYEIRATPDPVSIEVFDNGIALNTIPFHTITSQAYLFDTGDRNNSLNIPALAAVNQDGTVNSKTNPAAPGSIVSIFGSGLGFLSPVPTTGGLHPIPPAGPLSDTRLLRACLGCEILYLGSAPALSTAVFQANIRLAAGPSSAEVRAVGIGIAVAESPRSLFVGSPTGVVFVK